MISYDQWDDNNVVVFRRPGTGTPVVVPREIAMEAHRPYRANELRESGHSWAEVAEICGYLDASAAAADVSAWRKEAFALVSDQDRQMMLSEVIGQFDRVVKANWGNAMEGNIQAGNLVVNTLVNKSKLLQLDKLLEAQGGSGAPTTVVVVPADPENYVRTLERMAE